MINQYYQKCEYASLIYVLDSMIKGGQQILDSPRRGRGGGILNLSQGREESKYRIYVRGDFLRGRFFNPWYGGTRFLTTRGGMGG